MVMEPSRKELDWKNQRTYTVQANPKDTSSTRVHSQIGEGSITVLGFGAEYRETHENDIVYKAPVILNHNASAVPDHLLNKKYDTKPPNYVAHARIFQAAARSSPVKRKYESGSSDRGSVYSVAAGPPSRQRKKDQSDHRHESKRRKISSLNPKKAFANFDIELRKWRLTTTNLYLHQQVSTLVANRTTTSPGGTVGPRNMITVPRPASKLQKLIVGFPNPRDPFPEDFTLTEPCTESPNHLIGENLYPFLQHDWSPARIAALLPDQDGVTEADKVTANAIASRMRKVKAVVEKSGKHNLVIQDPKTHFETISVPKRLSNKIKDSESEEA